VGSLTLLGIGVLMLVAFGLFYWLTIFATFRAILAFAGVILVGYAGWLGRTIHTVTMWIVHLGNSLTGWALGVAVCGTALTLIAGGIFLHDLHPKKATQKRTGWAGVALALLLLAGATGIPALNGIAPGIRNGVSSVRTIGNGG
jgi:hypothetical protein